jgi:hypothetical protein
MINEIHTNCKDCAFATYSKITQVGCDFGKIDSYREAGAQIIEAYDDTKEFYVINDKICLYHRDKEWASKYTKSELKNIVEAQTKTPYHAIIIHRKENTIEDMEVTAKSLQNQFNPPSVLSIVNMHTEGSVYAQNMKFHEVLDNYKESYEWRVQNIVDDEKTIRESIDLAIDGTYFSYNYPYYITFDSGFSVPEDFSKELHDSVMLYGKQPIVAYGIDKSENCMLVNKIMHRKHTGNAFLINVEDKIKELEEDSQNHIFDIEELCPCLKK